VKSLCYNLGFKRPLKIDKNVVLNHKYRRVLLRVEYDPFSEIRAKKMPCAWIPRSRHKKKKRCHALKFQYFTLYAKYLLFIIVLIFCINFGIFDTLNILFGDKLKIPLAPKIFLRRFDLFYTLKVWDLNYFWIL
jgi:uncharacterized integral membrane protein